MKAKGFDFKQFGITHGEKVVLGVAGLLALFVLLKTTWGTYQKQPAALKKAAEDAGTLIASTKWPADESRKYPPDDALGIQIGSMLTPIPGDRLVTKNGQPGLELSISGTFSLYIREKPMTDPNYFAVRRLIATAFRPVIAKRSESYALADGGEADPDNPMNPMGKGATQKKAKTGFKVTKRGGAGADVDGTPMGPMGDKGFVPGRPGQKGTAGFNPGRSGPTGAGGAGAAGGAAAPGIAPPMGPMGEGDAIGAAGGGQLVEADGQRVIAVRGIFPIREQFLAFEKAMHLPEGLNPLDYVRMKDFVLERAVSTDGGKTFGKWTPVDKKANIEYLKTKVADFDVDEVAQGVTHYIITSPLPMRLLEYWGPEATHPDLIHYKLSPEAKRRQKEINEAVAKQREQMKKFQEEQEGGFGPVQNDMNRQRSYVMQDERTSRGFERYIKGQLDPTQTADDGDGGRTLLKTYIAEATAAGDLILFRYFDLDVLPGRTYKYRVKLVLHNPLFGQPVEKLALDAQGSNKAEFRDTPWSTSIVMIDGKKEVRNETEPVTVPKDVDVFVDNIVDRRSLRMDDPSITFTVYEWMPKLGTVVKGKVRDLEPGQTIAGKDIKTKRLDPAKEILFINVESEFQSSSIILDMQAGHRKLDDRHMRELGLPHSLKGRITAPDEVVVVDELGRLKKLDPLSMLYRYSSVDSQHNAMMKAFKEWEQDPAEVSKTEGDLGDPMDNLEGDPDSNKKKKKKAKRGARAKGNSPLRRGGRGGSDGFNPYGGAGGYGPMGPGSGYPKSGAGGTGRFRRGS